MIDQWLSEVRQAIEELRERPEAAQSLRVAELTQRLLGEFSAQQGAGTDAEQMLNDGIRLVAELAELGEAKCRAVLPPPPSEQPRLEGLEVEDGGPDPTRSLEEQLQQYQVYREAALRLQELAERWAMLCVRSEAAPEAVVDPRDWPEFEALLQERMAPGGAVSAPVLAEAFARVLARSRTRRRVLAVPARKIDLREAMQRLGRRLREAGAVPFEQLFEGLEDRLDVIATLLALLELVRLGEAHLEAAPAGGEQPETEGSGGAGLPSGILVRVAGSHAGPQKAGS